MPSGVDGVECLVTGAGSPVTLFLPGLGGSIDQLRPLGGGVHGTRVFCELSGPAAPEDFADMARTFAALADHYGADRALGVSLGAGGLLRLLTHDPDRFAQVVLYIPPALDVVSAARVAILTAKLRLAEVGDVEGLAAMLGAELPTEVRETRQAVDACIVRANRLVRPEALRLLANLAAGSAPVDSPGDLSSVTAHALVLGCREDPVHPVLVAEQVAAALPYSELTVFDSPGPPWSERRELRLLLSHFLSGQRVASS